jgi:hypothetical protein
MPVPGVPTLDPVPLPRVSPAQAGRPGEDIAELAQTTGDIADTGLALQAHIREAQKQVDTLAAENQFKAAYDQYQVQLEKTQNSRDIPDLITQQKATFNSITREWAKSPAYMQIQMYGESLAPKVQTDGQFRQVALMKNEGTIQLNQQAVTLADTYSNARIAGDQKGEQAALDGFIASTQSLVQSGLMGAVEAADTVRKFRQSGQELQIAKSIENADPKVNQAIYDQMNSHPENFPDVTPDKLAAYKEHAQSAVKSHIEFQNWAEGQNAQNTMLRPLINKWTNPATDQFDESKALGDIADQFSSGKITVYEQQALEKGVENFAADKDAGNKKQADQFEDKVLKLFHDHKYAEADATLEQGRPWLEENGLGDKYKGLLSYGDSQRRSERAEWASERSLVDFDERQAKIKEEAYSSAAANQLIPQIISGAMTPTDLLGRIGTGPGKISYQQYTQLAHLQDQATKEPDTKAALGILYDSLPQLPKTASPDDRVQRDILEWNLYQQWSQGVSEKDLKGSDKSEYALKLVKPFVSQDTADRLDKLLSPSSVLPNRGTSQKGVQRRLALGLTDDAPTTAPKVGDTKTFPNGRTGKWDGTGWVAQ